MSESLENKSRCAWCTTDALYQQYHDHEWGVISHDDRYLFAMLCLEGMQSGLSWLTILKKREHYYAAFDQFDATKIALYDETKVEQLMQNSGIIRHRGKILAIIHNAKCFLTITKSQPFHLYLWNIVGEPIINHWHDSKEIPTKTATSDKLAKQLKQDGFKFVGSTTCYAFMQAVGMVNDHLTSCDFYYSQKTLE